ncbi:MAG: amidohydrolase [Planctomycetes bacterium]|nr:amidohydrolase [Planctomycetota bacterium]
MIVDCHTHIWESAEQVSAASIGVAARHAHSSEMGGNGRPDASMDHHRKATEPIDKAFVIAFKSRYLGVTVPNELIFNYVRQAPDRLIGVAGIDPTNVDEALEELEKAHAEYGMRAIAVSPAAQDFHPSDSRAMQVFSEAARLRKPVLFQQGIHFNAAAKMEFARPSLLDEVARDLPQLRLVIAHMGYPWIDECVVLLGKHANVYADIASLIQRPWQAYNALLAAYQYGVIDKLLFGSDFPFGTPTKAIESLYRLNHLVTGTNLPTIPRQSLVSIVERDALGVLGIEPASITAASTALIDSEP